ncbi:MAG: hypothetical protein R3B54_03910 [Bdellovibrionota bacterium]
MKTKLNISSIKDEVQKTTSRLLSKKERKTLLNEVDLWTTRQLLHLVTPLARTLKDLELNLLEHSKALSPAPPQKPHLRRVKSNPRKEKNEDLLAIELAAQDPDYRGQNASGGQRPARTH